MRRWWRGATASARERAAMAIRRAAGLHRDPPEPCDDPAAAYAAVDGVARVVHGDLASMLVGGVASLLYQMLHPYAMAGVAQHSRYEEDPLGRLLRTANFISATTYGSTTTAHEAIERVRFVHRFVHGIADDGQPYDAQDPHLLLWVHCAEISMFLAAHRRFGKHRLGDSDADAYVAEMVRPARDLGVTDPPSTLAGLHAALEGFRPELRLSADAVAARDFIIRGVMTSRAQRLSYRLIVMSATSLLPPEARELLGVRARPVLERLMVRPATLALSRLVQFAVPPVPRQPTRLWPPSTATT